MSQTARSRVTVNDPIDSFLRDLPKREKLPWLAVNHGKIGLDIQEDDRTDHWTVTLAPDHIDVAKVGGEADLTIAGRREVFNQVVTGQSHAVAAVLRGALVIRGEDRGMVIAFQRLLPGREPVAEHKP